MCLLNYSHTYITFLPRLLTKCHGLLRRQTYHFFLLLNRFVSKFLEKVIYLLPSFILYFPPLITDYYMCRMCLQTTIYNSLGELLIQVIRLQDVNLCTNFYHATYCCKTSTEVLIAVLNTTTLYIYTNYDEHYIFIFIYM